METWHIKRNLLTQTGIQSLIYSNLWFSCFSFCSLAATIYHPLSHLSFLNACFLTFVTYSAKSYILNPGLPTPSPPLWLYLNMNSEGRRNRNLCSIQNKAEFPPPSTPVSNPSIDLIMSLLNGLGWKHVKVVRIGGMGCVESCYYGNWESKLFGTFLDKGSKE